MPSYSSNAGSRSSWSSAGGIIRRAVIAAVLSCSLAGCGEAESAKALREARIVDKSGGSYAEQCAAWNKVRDAYLSEGNDEQYRFARNVAFGKCALAN
jgi:hypothetical protein